MDFGNENYSTWFNPLERNIVNTHITHIETTSVFVSKVAWASNEPTATTRKKVHFIKNWHINLFLLSISLVTWQLYRRMQTLALECTVQTTTTIFLWSNGKCNDCTIVKKLKIIAMNLVSHFIAANVQCAKYSSNFKPIQKVIFIRRLFFDFNRLWNGASELRESEF